MTHKQLDPVNLYRDLGYVLFGTEVHHFLYNLVAPSPELKVLEAGCGSAKLSLGYALQCWQTHKEGGSASWRVAAFDIDKGAVEYARTLARALWEITWFPFELRHWFTPVCNDIHKVTAYKHYDLVFNEGVPQHWPDEERRQGAINQMAKACKPGGIVCVIGNNGSLTLHQKEDQLVSFGYEGMPPTRKCFIPEELSHRLERAGLVEVQTGPITTQQRSPGDGLYGDHSVLIAGWGKKPS